MTPEELEKLIVQGPDSDLVDALVRLTEPERKKLSKHVVSMRKRVDQWEVNRFYYGGRSGKYRLKLAIMGISPWTETQRLRAGDVIDSHYAQDYNPMLLLHILRNRKPDWLAKWVDKELADQNLCNWSIVRTLVREGVCPKPQSDNYIQQMVRGFDTFYTKKSLKQHLLDDPELLRDEVWRIFDLCPTREPVFYSYAFVGIEPRNPDSSWAGALKELAAEGHLDRQRLLQSSLGSLLKNTEARNTAWFSKFHEYLEPTPEERGKLQPSYLQMLSHRVPAVVGLAVEALKIVETAQQLNVPEFLRCVEPVFHLQPKAQPLEAVKLLGKLAARQPEQKQEIAAIMIRGLMHPHAQVQQAIVNQLAKCGSECHEVIATQLPGVIGSLAASVQAQAQALVGEGEGEVEAEPVAAPDELMQEAEQVISPWREWAGIDGVLSALRGMGTLSAVDVDPMRVPRLDPAQRVAPIQTLDELIERLTVAAETLKDPIEYEVLLDGLSRLCDQRPEDFDARLAPLVHRIYQSLPTRLAFSQGMQTSLDSMVLRWAGKQAPNRGPLEHGNSILAFVDSRTEVIAKRILHRQAAPLCACPTHRLGWIDPQALLHRLTWYEEHGLEPDFHDMLQALLRLAPDGRAAILPQAAALTGWYGAAFRYALGGPREEAVNGVLGIAAGRARTPLAARLEVETSEDFGPDAVQAAEYSWDIIPAPGFSSTSKTALTVRVNPKPADSSLTRQVPTVLLHNWRVSDGWNRWVGTVWPANPQPFFASGVRLRHTSFAQGQINRQRAEYLDPLFDPDVPFTKMAPLLLALALGQAEPEVTGLAVDALIVLIRDGRCVGQELGEVMGSLLKVNELKLNRLAKQMEQAGQASLLHAYACSQAMQTACVMAPEISRDLHLVLALLLEWLSALKQTVREDFRPMLEKVTTGKAGQLAKRLLKLSTTSASKEYLSVALEGRLERAKRWSFRADTPPAIQVEGRGRD